VVIVKTSGSLSLPYLHNVLEFEFAAIDIGAQDPVQYQLEGLEPDWVKLKNRLFVRFANLAPGKTQGAICGRVGFFLYFH
jgi:hypothetical protein